MGFGRMVWKSQQGRNLCCLGVQSAFHYLRSIFCPNLRKFCWDSQYFWAKMCRFIILRKLALVHNKSTKAGSNLQGYLVLTCTEISKCLLHRISIDMHRNLGFGSFGIPRMSTFNYFRYFAFQSVRTFKFKPVNLSINLFT